MASRTRSGFCAHTFTRLTHILLTVVQLPEPRILFFKLRGQVVHSG